MRYDLHLHSSVSDGQVAPAALVRAARVGGLNVIALTDHDTTLGVEDARAAADTSLFVIPGIEISTRHGIHDLHILGYWIDPSHPVLLEHQAIARRRREDRMQGMVDKLYGMGIRVDLQDVVDAAGPDARVLGRPHLARALFAAGYVRYYGEAFERFLHDGGPAFVMERFPSVPEAIEVIHAAGGLAVWAHPPRATFDLEVRRFAAAGLDGVECFRPTLQRSESVHIETAAKTLGLLVTGGSDWHGPRASALGDFFLGESEIRQFLDAEQSLPLRG